MRTKNTISTCELCREHATRYCASDSAFLCDSCDAQVHRANFLVARHVRQPLCSNCGSCLSAEHVCISCFLRSSPCHQVDNDVAEADDASSSSSSSLACISTTRSSAVRVSDRKTASPGVSPEFSNEVGSRSRGTRRNPNSRAMGQDEKAEGIFEIWSRRMGLMGGYKATGVVPAASRVLAVCLGRITVLPIRVAMAASFWLGMRMCGVEGCYRWQEGLRRVEEVSGVPARLILAAGAKLAKAVRAGKGMDLREGWAECGPQ